MRIELNEIGKGRTGVIATLLCFVLLFAVALQGTLVDVVLSVVSALLLGFLVRVDSKEQPADLSPEVNVLRTEIEDVKRARFILEQSIDGRFADVHKTVGDLDARIERFERRADEIEELYLNTERSVRAVRGWAAAGSVVAVFACFLPFLRTAGSSPAQVSTASSGTSTGPEVEPSSERVRESAVAEGEISLSSTGLLSTGLGAILPVLEPVLLAPLAPSEAVARSFAPLRSESGRAASAVRLSKVFFRAGAGGEITVEAVDGSVSELPADSFQSRIQG